MLATSEVAPAPELSSYVRKYAYRSFNTEGADILKPWHASQETTMPFFFKAIPIKLEDPVTRNVLKTGSESGIVGPSTAYNGEMTFNGDYSFFEIIFKPFGFQKIFGLPATEIIDAIYWTNEILDSSINLFFEQLCYAKGSFEMATLANRYLLDLLSKTKWSHLQDQIIPSLHLIAKSQGTVAIEKLAYDSHMSIRNFERRFNSLLGIPPKLFSRITRFNIARELKIKNPTLDWTAIAHHLGFFDQNHLIKDFKQFSGDVPKSLLNNTPLLA